MTKRNQRLTQTSTTEESNPERKEFKWRRLPEGLYVIYFENGGELPAELEGTWTSITKVQAAIENYKVKRGY